MAFQIATFIVTLAINYFLGQLTSRDGPRLKNKEPTSGEYGVGMPRAYGAVCRLPGIFIAQDDIKETKHKLGGNSTLIGAGMGAAAGFVVAGPVGAVVGGALGGLLGSATQKYYYTYSCTFAVLFADRRGQDPIEGIKKIYANGKLIFKASSATMTSETLDGNGKLIRRKYKKNKYFKSLTIYGGSTAQGLDPVLEDAVNEVSAYVFDAYAVIEDLQLEPFGQAVPALEGLLLVDSNETLADVAEHVALSAGIDPERDISTTALTPHLIRGYALVGETSCWDALKPLMPAFGVDCAEVAGQLRFYRRSQTMRASISLEDMGAHIYGDGEPEQFLFKRAPDLDLPKEASLTFFDPDRDHQANTATARRSEGNAKSNIAITVPLVLTADEGASAAALILWDAWLGRTEVNFSLPEQWRGIEAGLAYGIPAAGETVPYRITRRIRGANGIVEVAAISDESVTYTASVDGETGEIPDDPSTEFPATRPMFIDMPILQDGHDDYGFYLAMGAGDASWTRGRIEATGNGTAWASLVDAPEDAIMGDVSGTLAAGSTTGLDNTLDATTILTVVLLHDGHELEDATDAELDGWKNLCYVGKDGLGEYLQFKTATKIAAATWELSNLRRGRRGTDWAIGTHAAGEEFCLLDSGAGIYRIIYSGTAEWGDDFQIRGVTLHQDAEDAAIDTITNSGEGKRPFSPINVEGSWDGSNNLTATFDSRSRMFAGGLGIDDNFEFDVEITNAVPMRSMTVTAESFTYSAVDQAADGLTPGTIIEGRVRQTSDVNDGRWRDFIIFGPLATTADSTIITADDTTLTADAG